MKRESFFGFIDDAARWVWFPGLSCRICGFPRAGFSSAAAGFRQRSTRAGGFYVNIVSILSTISGSLSFSGFPVFQDAHRPKMVPLMVRRIVCGGK